jgi:hypothetical protein
MVMMIGEWEPHPQEVEVEVTILVMMVAEDHQEGEVETTGRGVTWPC